MKNYAVKMGITGRLFFFILFATCLTIFCLILIIWWNIGRDLNQHFRVIDQERHSELTYALGDKYKEKGNWDFLKNTISLLLPGTKDNVNIGNMTSSSSNRDEPLSWFERIVKKISVGKPLHSLIDAQKHSAPVRLIVLDADQKLIYGAVPPNGNINFKPVIVKNKTVGYVGQEYRHQFLYRLLSRILDQQKQELVLSAFIMVFIMIIISLPLARRFVKPIKEMAAATNDVASGRYATRIPCSSSDELGQLARDFNIMALSLEKNEKERRQLFADISHELRTPVAIFRAEIEAHIDGIQMITPETVSSLHAKTLRLEHLIEDLYQLSLSDGNALTYRKEYLDPIDVLKESVESFRTEFDHKHISLSLDLSGDLKATVFADRKRLDQLFLNLMENSYRYTDEGGEVRVGAQIKGNRLTIEFQDSKPGVRGQDRERLFERFYRVEKSRNVESGGAGLGLTICKNIVHTHEGTISAHESPLGGLMIRIHLPVFRGYQ